MQILLISLLVLFFLTAVLSLVYVQRTRAERHQRGIFGPWPIHRVSLPELDPVFSPNEFTGKSEYLSARNAPPEARVVTLTLGPDQLDEYSAERIPLVRVAGTTFVAHRKPAA